MGSSSKPGIGSRMVLITLCFFVVLLGFYFISKDHSTNKVTLTGHVAVPYVTLNNTPKGRTNSSPEQRVEPTSSSPTRLATARCDPFPCKPVTHRPIRIIKPGRNGWEVEPTETVYTDDNGYYSITVDEEILTSDGPVFVAAMDPTGTYPLMATIPPDLLYLGTLDISIDRTTTAAAVMHCPGGMNPPPRGAYCYSDPQESTDDENLYAQIDTYFEDNPSAATDPEEYVPEVSEDPDVQEEMDQELSDSDQPTDFEPITIDNEQDLEGLGQIILTGEEPTTISPTTLEQEPTTISPTNPPQTTNPPPTEPQNLPNGFPSDLPTQGRYAISVQVCAYSGCQQWSEAADENDIDINELIYYLNNANSFCNQDGYICKISYSGWDGRSFTMTASYQVCYQGTCSPTTTIYYRITKVG